MLCSMCVIWQTSSSRRRPWHFSDYSQTIVDCHIRKVPPDPNAPIAPLPLHLHPPPPRSASACPLLTHWHFQPIISSHTVMWCSPVQNTSLILERSLLTPTLRYLRFPFTFTHHHLLKNVSLWRGKRSEKGLIETSAACPRLVAWDVCLNCFCQFVHVTPALRCVPVFGSAGKSCQTWKRHCRRNRHQIM